MKLGPRCTSSAVCMEKSEKFSTSFETLGGQILVKIAKYLHHNYWQKVTSILEQRILSKVFHLLFSFELISLISDRKTNPPPPFFQFRKCLPSSLEVLADPKVATFTWEKLSRCQWLHYIIFPTLRTHHQPKRIQKDLKGKAWNMGNCESQRKSKNLIQPLNQHRASTTSKCHNQENQVLVFFCSPRPHPACTGRLVWN